MSNIAQKGFFTDEDLRPAYSTHLTPQCGKCGLFRACTTPKMGVTGEGKQKILIVADAPTKREDKDGKRWTGEAGHLLRGVLKKLGVSLEKDCWAINAINCKTKDGAGPDDKQIEYCRPLVMQAIKKLKPNVILLMGTAALKSVVIQNDGKGGKRVNADATMAIWRGWVIPDRALGAYIAPTFHPNYVLRQRDDDVSRVIWEQDISNSLSANGGEGLPDWTDPDKCITCYSEKDHRSIVEYLRTISDLDRSRAVAFDYETTGLKPQGERHKVVSMSVCADKDHAVAFPVYPKLHKHIVKFLRSKVGKIAANMKYEEMWSQEIFDTRVNNWVHDTCLAAHVLDNRRGIAGLDFQMYVNFGLLNYGGEVKKYFGSGEEKEKHGGNAVNNIDKIPLSRLLRYNAIDSLGEFRLAVLQGLEI